MGTAVAGSWETPAMGSWGTSEPACCLWPMSRSALAGRSLASTSCRERVPGSSKYGNQPRTARPRRPGGQTPERAGQAGQAAGRTGLRQAGPHCRGTRSRLGGRHDGDRHRGGRALPRHGHRPVLPAPARLRDGRPPRRGPGRGRVEHGSGAPPRRLPWPTVRTIRGRGAPTDPRFAPRPQHRPARRPDCVGPGPLRHPVPSHDTPSDEPAEYQARPSPGRASLI